MVDFCGGELVIVLGDWSLVGGEDFWIEAGVEAKGSGDPISRSVCALFTDVVEWRHPLLSCGRQGEVGMVILSRQDRVLSIASEFKAARFYCTRFSDGHVGDLPSLLLVSPRRARSARLPHLSHPVSPCRAPRA